MIEFILLLVTLLLVFACGIFVAAEFALIAVNRSTVERLSARGDVPAQGIAHALKTLSTQLSSAQVGITITNLAIGLLAEPVIAELIRPPLVQMAIPSEVVEGLAVTLALVIATALTMVFGELVPKNLAISRPLATAKFVQRPLLLFTNLARFPIKVLNGSANVILKQLGVEPQEELASARSADELLSLVRRSAEKGTLAKETAQMLERSLTFGDLTALDVMTPRVRVHAIQVDEPISAVFAKAKASGISRFPVYGQTLDDIRGIVHIKDVLSTSRSERHHTKTHHIMRPPVVAPSSIQLEPLLEDLKEGGLQMAIVVDEFGAVDGVVTMEDLVEELVGEVHDEHDPSSAAIRVREEGGWIISGLLRPDEIGEELDIYLPEEEEVETVAGLFMHQLERIPVVGDELTIAAVDREGEQLEVRLVVERMDGFRVDKLKMQLIGAEEEARG